MISIQFDRVSVQFDSVSVRYRIPDERILSLKEYAIRRLRGRVGVRDVWALRDVNLEVRRGEVLGVVGRNGAGKSTLLKVVARVLRPTTGRVRVRGTVVPLLEVGAGFQSELTGRENVYLNATLLGHSRQEIDERFQEIVEFAELEEFIDVPLRTMSSGMIVRLGFAVGTAWKPEILLLDEVLAVGDQPFQQKCRAKIKAFFQDGISVVLVSHNPVMVQELCTRAIWIDHGSVRTNGSPKDVIDEYLADFPDRGAS